ncbi:hypothetical protein FGB62_17g325 [Gracilaria domingensis]|nr:hypothetical protein FGB62_17g325 [Gracilaria domingensis]
MYYAFSEPLPLRHVDLNRSSALNILNTTCCTSRPPRVSSVSRAQRPKKKRARPRPRASHTQKREPTVADLSAQISQTIGLHIIKSDLDNLYSFFRSFVKVKTRHNDDLSNQPSVNIEPASDASHDSESNLEYNAVQAIGSSDDTDNSFVPKSTLGKAVASNYIAVRGSLDRTMETISLATQSLLFSMFATAGSTMYSILEAGERAFPALDFSSAKRTTQQMIEHGWNPLKSFQWQAAAMSDARKLRENRRERVEYVKEYLSGKAGGPWAQTLTFASRGVTTTFSVFENVTPELIQGASRFVSAGYGGLKAIGHWGAMESESDPLKTKGSHVLRSLRTGFAFLDKLPPLSSRSSEVTGRRSRVSLVPRKDSSLQSKSGSEHIKLPHSPAANRMRTKLSVSGRNGNDRSKLQNVEVIEAGKPSHVLQKGGAILGAGMFLMATSGISLPTAVTCSAIVITTVGVTQANAAVNETDIHQNARAVFRQSRTVRKLEKAIVSGRRAPKTKLSRKEDKTGLKVFHSKQGVFSPESSEAKARHFLKNYGARVKDEVIVDIDVQTYSVGHAEPTMLSVPVLGTLLNATDYAAYRIETTSGRLFSRLETVLGIRHNSTTWVLLNSFQRKS